MPSRACCSKPRPNATAPGCSCSIRPTAVSKARRPKTLSLVAIAPAAPRRADATPRPKVRSLSTGLTAEDFEAVRLVPGTGAYVAQRRASRCRVGPHAKARTYGVHPERRAVHPVGDVLLVFSTKEQPKPGQK